MAGELETSTLRGIAALPQTTVRQIGSHELLTDPSSVVKELVDNALDARAKSIFVDIAANTIDSIQVKDDGHGIPNEDRGLTCRRYCTSKIRDFHDLKEVGGKWLGFRGEALASIADISGTVSITTRVEGESVAVKLIYQRNGELATTERESHPVGTTVKVTKLLETARVRKELAVKGATKRLAKIRRLLQAYALARPAVRFRLHVLNAKTSKNHFVYAPKPKANVEDAALKIVGVECALQCDWTALKLDGFEVRAFMPKPTAVGAKIANHGAFIAVDSRPVSSTRGTLKKVAVAIRDRLRKANTSLATVKDPFFCLSIVCPVDSYDPNIEPAKDDVIFGDEVFILTMIDRLLMSYYPDNINIADPGGVLENVALTLPSWNSEAPGSPPRPHSPFPVRENLLSEVAEAPERPTQGPPPRWRSSMYGIDEEDFGFLPGSVSDMPEEDESGRHDAAISNPWTIARMNAPIKPKKPVSNGQLPSPAKSLSDMSTAPHFPVPAAAPRQIRRAEPLTTHSSSQAGVVDNPPNNELQQSVQGLSGPESIDYSASIARSGPSVHRTLDSPSFQKQVSPSFVQSLPRVSIPEFLVEVSGPPQRKPQNRKSFRNKPHAPPIPESEDTWFGQPMRNAPRADRSQRRPGQQPASFLPNNDTLSSQRSLVLPTIDRLVETRLTSENNADIRDFFGNSRRAPADVAFSRQIDSPRSQLVGEQLHEHATHGDKGIGLRRRPRSASSYQRSTSTAQEMDALFQHHQNESPAPNSSPIRQERPSRNASMPATRSTSRPRRPRTTDGGLHRTRSSTLPLNFISHGFEIHSLTLQITTRASSITRQAHKIGMSANTLEWGYDSTYALDTFGKPIDERKITQWVIKVDNLLAEVFERRDVEIRDALHEGVQRFLDMRKGDVERALVQGDKIPGPNHSHASQHPDASDGGNGVAPRSLRGDEADPSARTGETSSAAVDGTKGNVAGDDAVIAVDETKADFDIEQLVDLDGGLAGRIGPAQVIKMGNDFGNGGEDEMLMDL